MRYLKEDLENIPSDFVEIPILEEAKSIAAGRILELVGKQKFYHFNLRKLRSFEEREEIIGFYGSLFGGISENIRSLLVFIYWLHDIGFCNTGINKDHGRAAVALLREWGISGLFDAGAREAIEYAIENHNEAQLPLGSDNTEVKNVLARVLRDFDKMGGFIHKSDGWIYDKSAKKKEIDYCRAKGECGVIDPESILSEFERLGLVDKKFIINVGVSYESVVLLFFAWIFDINYKETMAVLIERKIPDKFLFYFKKQLIGKPGQYERIEKAYLGFLDKNGF